MVSIRKLKSKIATKDVWSKDELLLILDGIAVSGNEQMDPRLILMSMVLLALILSELPGYANIVTCVIESFN